MAKKRKFLDFMDRFDGGGAGKMGDEFEGGGLLSAFANMAASPYGSEDEMRRKARKDFYSSQNIGGDSMGNGARVSRPTARPSQMPMVEPPMNAFPGMQDMRRSGQFNPDAPVPSFPPNMSGAPASSYAPAAQTALAPIDQFGGMPPAFTEANSFATFISGLGPEARNNTLGELLEAHRLHMQGYSN